MAEKDLNDLFLDTLKDIYYAEKQILKALPKMAKAANSDKLRAAFEKHHDETEGQIERLEKSLAENVVSWEACGLPPGSNVVAVSIRRDIDAKKRQLTEEALP